MTAVFMASMLGIPFGLWVENLWAGLWMAAVGIILDVFYDKLGA